MAAEPQTFPTVAAEPAPAAAGAAYRFGWASTLAIGAALAVLVAAFWPPLQWLWQTWRDRPEYSHGPILPLVAAYLLWQRQDDLQRTPFRSTVWGPVVVAVGGCVYLLGQLGAAAQLQQYAFVTMFAGLVLSITGPSAFRYTIAAMLTLVLMVPLPNFVLNNLSVELQLISSSLGVALIRAAGISVLLEGNVIDLGGYQLQVVEACDGLRYLFPLMSIALLIAYFYKGATWKRVLVFVASVPITVLMNSLRVGVIGILVEHWGTAMAEGFLHEFQGWMVFMLSAALLIALTAILHRVGAERGTWRQTFGIEAPVPRRSAGAVERTLPWSFYASAAAIAAVAIVTTILPSRGEQATPRTSFAEFPQQLGPWRARPVPVGAEYLGALQLDDYLSVELERAGSPPVSVYVPFHASQRDRAVVHSPRACLPGGGWRIESLETVTPPGIDHPVNRMMIAHGEARQLVYYWFEQRGRQLTNEYLVKAYLFVDAIGMRRSDGAMVRLATAIARGETPADAEARLADVAARVSTPLAPYVAR